MFRLVATLSSSPGTECRDGKNAKGAVWGLGLGVEGLGFMGHLSRRNILRGHVCNGRRWKFCSAVWKTKER